jgi:hypothetical protein
VVSYTCTCAARGARRASRRLPVPRWGAAGAERLDRVPGRGGGGAGVGLAIGAGAGRGPGRGVYRGWGGRRADRAVLAELGGRVEAARDAAGAAPVRERAALRQRREGLTGGVGKGGEGG